MVDTNTSYSPSLATFDWKGRNYLEKMSHDLDFLSDHASLSTINPVSAWLGFSTHRNPFLIPPEGHDIRETLRIEHEKRRHTAAARRTQRRRESFGQRGANPEMSGGHEYVSTSLSPRQQPRSNTIGDDNIDGKDVEMVRAGGSAASVADDRAEYESGIETWASTGSGLTNLPLPGGDFEEVLYRTGRGWGIC